MDARAASPIPAAPSLVVPCPTVSDRDELTSLLSAGGDVLLDPGRTYLIDGGLFLTRPVRVDGRGATLKIAGAVPEATRNLSVLAPGCSLYRLNLDGNWGAQAASTGQRHGIFARGAAGLVVRQVSAVNCAGDGICLNNDVDDAVVDQVACTANGRNGLTFDGDLDGARVSDSHFQGNAAQQVDCEPGGTAAVRNVELTGCVLDAAGASDDFVLAISGTEQTQGGPWLVHGCVLNGGVNVVWADDVGIHACRGTNATAKPCLRVWRRASRVLLRGSSLALTSSERSNAVVYLAGTGPGSCASGVALENNTLTAADAASFGIRAEGCLDFAADGNALIGSGRSAGGYAGIEVRATIPGQPVQRVVLTRNDVSGFGDCGVLVQGMVGASPAATVGFLQLSENVFGDAAGAVQLRSALLDGDRSGALRSLAAWGNRYRSAAASRITGVPPGCDVLVLRD